MPKPKSKSKPKSKPKSKSKAVTREAAKARPDPSDPRLHKVVLTFTVKVEEGSIDSMRMLDACSAAAEVLGVKSGEILPGARLGLSFPKEQQTEQTEQVEQVGKDQARP